MAKGVTSISWTIKTLTRQGTHYQTRHETKWVCTWTRKNFVGHEKAFKNNLSPPKCQLTFLSTESPIHLEFLRSWQCTKTQRGAAKYMWRPYFRRRMPICSQDLKKRVKLRDKWSTENRIILFTFLGTSVQLR